MKDGGNAYELTQKTWKTFLQHAGQALFGITNSTYGRRVETPRRHLLRQRTAGWTIADGINGARPVQRRQRQIAAGILTESNGLVRE